MTGPFWRYLKKSTISILDMSEVYTMMKDKFDEWGQDSLCLVENQATLFEDCTTTADDEVAHFLFQPTDKDGLVQELLQLLFKSFSLTIQRLLIDHLPVVNVTV